MKPYLSTDTEVAAARQSDLENFGCILANPSEIDAVVRGPVVVDRTMLGEDRTMVILRSGVKIEIMDANDARALYESFERGIKVRAAEKTEAKQIADEILADVFGQRKGGVS